MIPETTLTSLRRVGVSVTGQWSRLPKRDWQGSAVCAEPIVGVAILEVDSSTEWCISNRDDPEVRLTMGLYDKVGLDVQVAFSVGHGGRRWRTLVSSPTYLPSILPSFTVETGRVFTFAAVEGKPQIVLKSLFIARADVKSSRNGVWHIRPELATSLPAPFHKILTYGRSGAL
jgi:hypothetical protein